VTLAAKLNPAVAAVFLETLLLLLLATGAVVILRWLRPSGNFDELQQRIKTWWIIATLFLGSLIPGRAWTLAFFAFVSFLALKEYFSLIPTRRADRRVLFYAYASIPIQFAWVYWDWYGMFAIFIPVYMFLFLPLRMVMIGETNGFLTAVGTLYWGLMTTVYSLSHLGALLLLPHQGGSVWRSELTGGVSLVLYVAVLTQLNDVMQYVWGKALGKSKVVPSVSPGKTWAGLIGGVCTTIVLSVALAPLLTPLTRLESALAGAIIGLGGFIGDITVSAVKRDLHQKDSGTMLPGHGGILDRVDSLTYTAPLFFHLVRYLHF
jgi:phosphatidate cytidylyltransferase